MTLAPSRARSIEVARPMPEPPPVTSTIFPCSSPAMIEILRDYFAPEVVVTATTAADVIIAAEVATALEFVDRFVEFRTAELVAHLLAHLAHHARDTLGVVLIEPAQIRGIGESVHPRLLAARRG